MSQNPAGLAQRPAHRHSSKAGYRFNGPEASDRQAAGRSPVATTGGARSATAKTCRNVRPPARAEPRCCLRSAGATFCSVTLFHLYPSLIVVAVKCGAFLIAGALVRPVAEGLVFRKTARADVDGQLGSFGNFVWRVALVFDQSSHCRCSARCGARDERRRCAFQSHLNPAPGVSQTATPPHAL